MNHHSYSPRFYDCCSSEAVDFSLDTIVMGHRGYRFDRDSKFSEFVVTSRCRGSENIIDVIRADDGRTTITAVDIGRTYMSSTITKFWISEFTKYRRIRNQRHHAFVTALTILSLFVWEKDEGLLYNNIGCRSVSYPWLTFILLFRPDRTSIKR